MAIIYVNRVDGLEAETFSVLIINMNMNVRRLR